MRSLVRRLLVSTAFFYFLVSALSSPVMAQEVEVEGWSYGRDSIVVQGFSRRPSKGSAIQRSAATFSGLVTTWDQASDGTTCISENIVGFATQQEADAANAASGRRDWLVPPECPVGPGQVVRGPVPEEVALAFWREVGLPAPEPVIAPGYAVTGKTAYLESNSLATVPYSFETPLGPLVIEAEARLFVDWGDGRGRREYSSLGGPWPEGEVTNVYGEAGLVDVVVDQEWTASWSVAGATGTLGGLATRGTIPRFEVREVQAVID